LGLIQGNAERYMFVVAAEKTQNPGKGVWREASASSRSFMRVDIEAADAKSSTALSCHHSVGAPGGSSGGSVGPEGWSHVVGRNGRYSRSKKSRLSQQSLS
jgi:hypothetical protein